MKKGEKKRLKNKKNLIICLIFVLIILIVPILAILYFNFKKNWNKITLSKKSIDRYGDLKSDLIAISFDEFYKFKVAKKTFLNSIEKLKTEYKIQTGKNLPLTNINWIKKINNSKLNIDQTTFTKAKAKKRSIDTYGNLKNDRIKVDYEENDYTFQVDKKPKLNLIDLNTQLNIQGDTEEDYTINDFGSLNIDSTTLTKATEKKISIETYGDLTTNNLIVSFDGTEFKFNIRNLKTLNILDLNIEYEKQTGQDLKLTNIENVENSVLIIDPTTLKKAKTKKHSIDTYGDLREGKISFRSIENENIFDIGTKLKMNHIELEIELNNQDITEDEKITDGSGRLIFDEIIKIKELKIKESIKTYGNLRTDSIKVDYEENDYTFQVDQKQKLNLETLNDQLDIQGDTVNEDYTINDFGTLNIDSTSLAKAKAKKHSIETYGDLTGKGNEPLKVIYETINQEVLEEIYKFQIGSKQEILNFNDFNVELKRQNINKEYNIDSLIEENQKTESFFKFDQKETPRKAKSFQLYGNLTGSEEKNLKIIACENEDGNKFLEFQIGNKIKIGKNDFNIQLQKQGNRGIFEGNDEINEKQLLVTLKNNDDFKIKEISCASTNQEIKIVNYSNDSFFIINVFVLLLMFCFILKKINKIFKRKT